MVRAEEKIKAVAASDDQAGLLNIVSGSPVLQVERVSFTYGDRPMELRRGLYLTDRFHYRNTLSWFVTVFDPVPGNKRKY